MDNFKQGLNQFWVGAVFGVGFLREFLVNKNKPMAAAVANGEISSGQVSWEETPLSTAKNLKKAKKAQKRKLVRRRHLVTIVAAWVITVPAAAILSGLIFLALREMLQG